MKVAQALAESNHLAVEAGTGVGKSYGYLIPAVLHALVNKKRVIVSTHTINLQEQLLEKDIPYVQQVLKKLHDENLLTKLRMQVPEEERSRVNEEDLLSFKAVLVKGRANYLCPHRLWRAVRETKSLFVDSEQSELLRIAEWAHQTKDGTLSTLNPQPDQKVWAEVCSERGLCSPKLCESDGETCFFQQTRRQMRTADLLVANHHLLFTELGIREDIEDEKGERTGIILPPFDNVIHDEAHTMEATASEHIGIGLTLAGVRRWLHRLANPKTKKGLLVVAGETRLIAGVEKLLRLTEAFFSAVERFAFLDEGRSVPTAIQPATDPTERSSLREQSNTSRIRGPDVVPDILTEPIRELLAAVAELIKTKSDEALREELLEWQRRGHEIREQLQGFLGQSSEGHVYWIERSGIRQTNIELRAAPVNVAPYLRQMLFDPHESVIMTSATLTVGGQFDYFLKRVGGESADRLQLGSPFDFQSQMKIFIPKAMPDPRDEEYQNALIRWLQHFISKTHGKALVLFTSHRLLKEAAAQMEDFFEELGVTCYVQGGGTPRSVLLRQFKDEISSVLFGTESFWQGVDVPGESLSNVIITRLPFAVPDHPLTEARI